MKIDFVGSMLYRIVHILQKIILQICVQRVSYSTQIEKGEQL